MTPILAFDIETVPDVPGIRRLYDLPESLPDDEVAEVAFQKRRAVSAPNPGSDGGENGNAMLLVCATGTMLRQ